MCCNSGVSGAAIVLVLFILLIIILGAYIQGGDTMSSNSSCGNTVETTRCTGNNYGNAFVIIIVLYILLAIIIGTYLY